MPDDNAHGITRSFSPEGGEIATNSNSPPALTPGLSPGGRGELVARDPRIVLDAGKQRAGMFYVRLGASRRMAAREVGCCHRTIARAAARDPDFAHELARARPTPIKSACNSSAAPRTRKSTGGRPPGCWSTANPEEFAARKPHTFSSDHVLELFTRFLHAVLPKLPADCRETLLDQFDDVAGELVKDPNALPDRAKLEVKDAPPAPVLRRRRPRRRSCSARAPRRPRARGFGAFPRLTRSGCGSAPGKCPTPAIGTTGGEFCGRKATRSISKSLRSARNGSAAGRWSPQARGRKDKRERNSRCAPAPSKSVLTPVN